MPWKLVILGLLILTVLSAGCSSVCVPVHVQKAYPQINTNYCTVVIENTSYVLHGPCTHIEPGKINWLSFDDSMSAYQGIDSTCTRPPE